MARQAFPPPRNARNLSIRLDETTDYKLRELVEHYNENGPGTTESQVIRHAVDELHKRVVKR